MTAFAPPKRGRRPDGGRAHHGAPDTQAARATGVPGPAGCHLRVWPTTPRRQPGCVSACLCPPLTAKGKREKDKDTHGTASRAVTTPPCRLPAQVNVKAEFRAGRSGWTTGGQAPRPGGRGTARGRWGRPPGPSGRRRVSRESLPFHGTTGRRLGRQSCLRSLRLEAA